jgi:hypothetical protein
MAPRVPNAAQLTQLATLQATLAAAMATLNTNVTNHVAAQNAVLLAQQNLKNYESYIYGGQKPGIIDEGLGAT